MPTATPVASDLAVTLIGPAILIPNSQNAYTATVRNVGAGATVGDTRLLITLPAGMVFTSGIANGAPVQCGPSGTGAGQTVLCSFAGSLAPGQTVTVAFQFGVAAQATGVFTVTARATTGNDRNPQNDTAVTTTPIRPALAEPGTLGPPNALPAAGGGGAQLFSAQELALGGGLLLLLGASVVLFSRRHWRR